MGALLVIAVALIAWFIHEVRQRRTHPVAPGLHPEIDLPYTEECLAHVVDRIRRVQDFVERPLVLENPSTYLTFASDRIPEAEFIARMAEASDCALLLDVNNVYVTCRNHELDPWSYLKQIPLDRVVQVHLAGHTDKGTHCIDTHDDRVRDEVWELYGWVQEQTGGVATLLEWDAEIAEFPVLQDELAKCLRYREALSGSSSPGASERVGV